eukprot:SAG22_NODE_5872_length_938_cov_1.486293_1_plen_153_part_01
MNTADCVHILGSLVNYFPQILGARSTLLRARLRTQAVLVAVVMSAGVLPALRELLPAMRLPPKTFGATGFRIANQHRTMLSSSHLLRTSVTSAHQPVAMIGGTRRQSVPLSPLLVARPYADLAGAHGGAGHQHLPARVGDEVQVIGRRLESLA